MQELGEMLAIYHKRSTKQGVAPVDMVYMVFKSGVCCKPNAPKLLLRYTRIKEFTIDAFVLCLRFLV